MPVIVVQRFPMFESSSLTARDEFRRHVARISYISNDNPTTGQDADPSNGGVVQAQTQPGLGRKLQSATHKVPNNVRMTDHQLVAVLLLGCLSSVEILAECSFDARSVLEELLKNRRGDWLNVIEI